MRLIDADAYKAEMKTRQDACAEWRDEAKADRNEELYARAEQALATFIEAKLTLDKMPTIDAVPVVRCEECRWCHAGFCELHDDIIPWGAAHTRWRDWFCADGQRRQEATDG